MPSKSLLSLFNRALLDETYQKQLFDNLDAELNKAPLPKEEAARIKKAAPKNIQEMARLLEQTF